jgi:hypothetical protein
MEAHLLTFRRALSLLERISEPLGVAEPAAPEENRPAALLSG